MCVHGFRPVDGGWRVTTETPPERTPRSGKQGTSRSTQANARYRMRLRAQRSRGTRATT